jgi:hypothetical protein
VLKGIVECIVIEFLAINHGNMKECCTMQGIGSTAVEDKISGAILSALLFIY